LSALAIIQKAAECGISLSLNGDNVAFKASAKPSPDMLAALKQHKPEIVALLRQEAGAEADKSMAAGGAQRAYSDAFAMLQLQQPMGVGEHDWRQAIDAAGRFLDAWASLAVEFGWTAGGGLVGFCARDGAGPRARACRDRKRPGVRPHGNAGP